MNDLKKKNIIVTGATGGIGNSIIKKLNEHGANILASGTKSEKYNIKMIWEDNKTNCAKCNKIPSNIEYKGKSYCTWYCAKKG